jgi:protein-tyrosine phosphatase
MPRHPESVSTTLCCRRQFLKGTLGVMLLPAAGGSLLAGCGSGDTPTGAAAAATSRIAATPRLASVSNFRDIAGADAATVYRTASGRTLRRGVFFRANALTPSAADLAVLNTLDIRAIYDLRTPSEIAAQPDAALAGAAWINVNLLGADSPVMAPLNTAADAIAMMEHFERQMVTGADVRARLAHLFTAMAGAAGAQLYHCTAGKDRTGWVTAVLLSLVEVPPSVIMRDYLLSNTYLAADIDSQYAAITQANGPGSTDAYRPLLGVQASFLQAGLDQAAQSYGSKPGYIANGLGLSAATQAKLRAKLLN